MYNNTPYSDRRRFQRLSMNLCVLYRVVRPVDLRVKFGDREIEADMVDISAGGMSLVTENNIPATSVLHLKFSLFKIDKNSGSAVFYRPYEIKGHVRSNIKMENGHRLGICFIRHDGEVSQDMHEIAKTVTLN